MTETMPPMRGLRHVAIRCRDLARMESFYRELLGYQVEWRPSERELYLSRGDDNLALHAGPEQPGETRIDHIGLLVAEPDHVDAWARWLEAHDVELDTLPRTHRDGARSFYARDPEGNRLQFLYHPPISRKGMGG